MGWRYFFAERGDGRGAEFAQQGLDIAQFGLELFQLLLQAEIMLGQLFDRQFLVGEADLQIIQAGFHGRVSLLANQALVYQLAASANSAAI